MKNSYALLVALALALGLGWVASSTGSAFLLELAAWVRPIGAIWIAFLKMTMLPLVIALLITSVGSGGSSKRGPLLKKTLLVFIGLYTVTVLAAMVLMSFGMQLLPASASIPANLIDPSAISGEKPISLTEQVMNWIPQNPFKAAADGALLPLVIFSLIFGLALNYVTEEPRNTVTAFFNGVTEVMLKIVEWVLIVVPLGIFCIVFPLTSEMGANLVGALGFYVAASLVLSMVCIVVVCLIAIVYTRTSFMGFMSACLRPQIVAAGTQSSLATLPSMIEASIVRMKVPPRVADTVLPLAVAVFKVGSAIAGVSYVYFTARMYGIELTPSQVIITFAVALATAVGGAGLPSGASFFAPIITLFMAVGLPLELIPVLFAVDTLPDMAQTVTNVSADLAAVKIVEKGQLDL